MRQKLLRAALLLALCTGGIQAPAFAQSAPAQPQEGAFVEHHVALQISDNTPEKQKLMMNVANNILKTYGPDKVAIEVVAFGPGLELLNDTNPNLAAIESLAAQGVSFDACGNTMETYQRNNGKPFPLNKIARVVPAGVPQLIELSEHGFVVIRP